MKECTCSSYQLFQGGCQCGSVELYQPPHLASSLLKPVVCLKCNTHLGEELASSSCDPDAITLCDACVAPALDDLPYSYVTHILPVIQSAAPATKQHTWLDDLPIIAHPPTPQIIITLKTPPMGQSCFPTAQQMLPPVTRQWNIVTGAHGAHTLELSKWLPDVDPKPGDHWCGIDRSIDSTRLAGSRWSKTIIEPYDNVIMGAEHMISREGGRADVCYVHPATFNLLCFLSLKQGEKCFLGTQGTVIVKPESSIAKNRAYMLQLDSWYYDKSNGIAYCTNPGFNACILL